jgi:hypothetical protein
LKGTGGKGKKRATNLALLLNFGLSNCMVLFTGIRQGRSNEMEIKSSMYDMQFEVSIRQPSKSWVFGRPIKKLRMTM